MMSVARPKHSQWLRFAGFNINDNPVLTRKEVLEDIDTALEFAHVVVIQEFRWSVYWEVLKRFLKKRPMPKQWATSPPAAVGVLRPTRSAQVVGWRRKFFRKVTKRKRVLHKGSKRISEARWIRAVLLEDRTARLSCWYGTTHNVVRGDDKHDPEERKDILEDDLDVLDEFLGDLVKTGHPVIWQMDGNIRPGTWAYARLRAILKKHGARLYGEHGIEYLFVIDGVDVKVRTKDHWEVGHKDLNTPHEGRGITYRLEAA